MTSKIPMKFLRGWSNFNKGDIASFDADRAAKLEEQKVAVRAPVKAAPQDLTVLNVEFNVREMPEFKAVTLELERAAIDLSERETAVRSREGQIAAHADELDSRETRLNDREADLAKREEAFKALIDAQDGEAIVIEGAETVDPETGEITPSAPAAKPAADAAASLPKQGRKG